MADGLFASLASTLRRMRRGFTRENLVANLKTLITVVPLTILVWVYAEQQQLVTEKEVPVRIMLQSSDPAHRQVTLVSPLDGTVQLTLQGSQAGIDRVKANLQQTLISNPLEIDLPNDIPVGAREPLVTLSQLAGNRIFFSQGVAVTDCSPLTLVTRVDELQERDVPVQAPPDVPGLVKAVFHPATVKMRGPVALLNDLSRNGHLFAVADVLAQAALKQPGEHKNIPLPLLAREDLTFTPATVTADLTVGQADQTMDVSPVPVKVLAPKWLMDNYKFDYKEVLPLPVTLSGPPVQMAQIDPRNPKLLAVVELENDDAGKSEQKSVTLEDKGLPDGVHVKPDGLPITVSINITPR